MLRRKMTSLVLALAAVTAFAACGDGGGGGGDETETDATTGGDTGGDTGGNGDGLTVDLTDFEIDAPKKAKVGDTITVTNNGDVAHNWTSEDGGFATEEQLAAGASEDVTLEKAGTFDYVCTLHANDMKGKITVEE